MCKIEIHWTVLIGSGVGYVTQIGPIRVSHWNYQVGDALFPWFCSAGVGEGRGGCKIETTMDFLPGCSKAFLVTEKE